MHKLSDTNNSAPLAGDFNMYYRGTYVAKEVKGGCNVMYVENVDGAGDDSKLSGVRLFGSVRSDKGDIGQETWAASDIVAMIPSSGYYKFQTGPKYVSFLTENRTQKKGLNPNRLMIDGVRASGMNMATAYCIYNNDIFEGKFSNDLCLIKSELRWKSYLVGELHDGNLTIFTKYEHLQELICKLLERSLAIKSIKIQ